MITRLKELTYELSNAANEYYNNNNSVMSDKQYDTLLEELESLEKQLGMSLSGSPTQKVGYDLVTKLEKVKHAEKLLSLDKTKEVEALNKFMGDQEILLSWKLDGITLVLTYKNGEIKQAVTRGNGEIGEDITHNVKHFTNVPLKISYKDELVIRGEAVIYKSDFELINERNGGIYKNPRNLASGSARQLDSEIAKDRYLTFIAFNCQTEGFISDNKSEQLEALEKLGFDVVRYEKCNKSTGIEPALNYYKQAVERYEVATDGLVATYNSIKYSKSLGTTSKFPRHSIAFKWADDIAETTLREIEWSASRTGLINPVAIFDPVELEGTTVSRAGLHNISMVRKLKLGIGDTIEVYKANMIIPQVHSNLTQSNTLEIPDTCPVCGGETKIERVVDSDVLKCKNILCPAKVIQTLVHFVSRDAMNIDGVSTGILEMLANNGLVSSSADLYKLHEKRYEFSKLYKDGERIIDKILQAIEKSRNVKYANFIYALGINNVGLSTAKTLAKRFDSMVDLIQATESELMKVEDIGEITAQSIVKFFNNRHKMSNFILLTEEVDIDYGVEIVENSGCAGLTFVVTGDVYLYKNRKELQADIEARGGKIAGSVSGKTDYLITNDTTSGSSKNKKAQELGVKIISEQEFVDTFIGR